MDNNNHGNAPADRKGEELRRAARQGHGRQAKERYGQSHRRAGEVGSKRKLKCTLNRGHYETSFRVRGSAELIGYRQYELSLPLGLIGCYPHFYYQINLKKKLI